MTCKLNTLADAAAHTALLLVDPYNDFLSEGGKLNALANQSDAGARAPRRQAR